MRLVGTETIGKTMSSAKMRISLDPSADRQATRLLEQIDALVRGPAINKVLKGVGEQIKRDTRAILPKPGYPGDKPELKPLRDSLAVKVVSYRGGEIKVLIVGYTRPKSMADATATIKGRPFNHGAPLEGGHEKWLWGEHIEGSPVDAYPYLKEVVQLTRVTQSQTLINGARAALAKARGT